MLPKPIPVISPVASVVNIAVVAPVITLLLQTSNFAVQVPGTPPL